MDIAWAEKQHLNYLLKVLEKAAESEEDRKPKKLTDAELMAFVTADDE